MMGDWSESSLQFLLQSRQKSAKTAKSHVGMAAQAIFVQERWSKRQGELDVVNSFGHMACLYLQLSTMSNVSDLLVTLTRVHRRHAFML